MKATTRSNIVNNTATRVALVTTGVLLIPLLARFPWTVFDFVVMGVLISATTFVLDQVVRRVDAQYRVIAAIAVLGIFFVIWAQLAVGLVTQIITGELWIYEYLR